MPRPRFEKLPVEKQQAILDAAAHEFAENGFEGASYNRIIAAAGVSKGAMYYYFDDKEDLYVTVIKQVFAMFFEVVGDFPPVGSAQEYWDVFRDVMQRSIKMFRDDPRSADLSRSFQLLRKGGDLGPSLQALMDEAAVWTRELVRRGQEVGAIRTDLPLELLTTLTMELDAIMDGWLAEHWDEMTRAEREATLEKTVDLFRRISLPGAEEEGAR